MSRQDKATTEKHTRQLRELVKRPENKTCADCKHNDPRWASWNIGVFLCIRCSGIHRGMGTHISKVKSIDLDTWTPEQMESIMRWGNKRANMYWEAHLKRGHIPPDHKMESFIRSKYESRRWAMDGPPPRDPAVLESGTSGEPVEPLGPTAAATSPPDPAQQHRAAAAAAAAAVPHPHRASPAPTTVSPVSSHHLHSHQLLSAQHVRSRSAARVTPVTAVPSPAADLLSPAASAPALKPSDDLFSLDFHAPAPTTSPSATQGAQKKDVKQDILSLFSTSSTTPAAAPVQASPWTAPPFSNASTQVAAPPLGFSAWTSVPPVQANVWTQPAVAAAPSTSNAWGQPTQPQQQASLFNTDDIWANSGSIARTGTMSSGADIWGSVQSAPAGQKEGDAFGDLLGGFK
ncbi:hypothetical protein K488DRAFT_81204 [Vararia minispora EC-137]|uniref:Uncharacterized protein n=1 Tax=Vararia minispora EC-137 TaxID=1314806 RepID=A0ACB8Q6B8_9AGAM|nr:hypothetical protein K488DRAFT_81204 [Vararia minispora EC-137]